MNEIELIAEQMAALGIEDDAKSSDLIMLRQAITAEYDAVSLYEQMAASAESDKLRELMLSVAKEEKVHIGEFESMLDELDKEHKAAVEDGKQEAADL